MSPSVESGPSVKNLRKLFESFQKNEILRSTESLSCNAIRQVEKSSEENKKSFKETAHREVLKIIKTKRKEVKSFTKFPDETNDEIEIPKQEISQDMGSEYKRMRIDGFLDEFVNIARTKKYASKIRKTAEYNKVSTSYNNFDEDFSESIIDLGDDAYVLECYNDDGTELVKLEISRTTIKLNDISTLKRQNEAANSESIVTQNGNVPVKPVKNFKELLNIYQEGPINEKSFPVLNHENKGVNTRYQNIHSSSMRRIFSFHQGNIGTKHIGFTKENNKCKASEITNEYVERNDSFHPSKELLYLIKELKTTEQTYVEDLKKIIKKCMQILLSHIAHIVKEDDRARTEALVGDLSKMYPKQKKFMHGITKCGENVDSITMKFLKYKDLFDLYSEYFRNKSQIEHILILVQPLVKQMQSPFEVDLDFFGYPRIRLEKYISLLENIKKELTNLNLSCENTQKALDMMKSVISKADDYVAIESIQRSKISRDDYGSFIMRQKFRMNKPRKLETVVFLFSNVIVFTLEDQQHIEKFIYFGRIKLEDLTIVTLSDGTIRLTDYSRTMRYKSSAQQYTFILETKDDKVRKVWGKTIEDMLSQKLEMKMF